MEIPDAKIAEFEAAMIALRQVKMDSKEQWLDFLGLTESQVYALIALARTPGQTAGDVARDLCVSASASTQTIETLVRRGFVQRTEDPHDRRIMRLELTPTGVEQVKTIGTTRRQYLAQLLSGLSVKEVDTVITALTILTKVIAKHQKTERTSTHAQS